LIEQNRALTELCSVGLFIEKQIQDWIEKPPHRAKIVSALRQRDAAVQEPVRRRANPSCA